MTVREAFEFRRSVPSFDASVSISREELGEIVDLAVLAPTSMNLQPYALLLCHSAEDKARLQAVSFDQKKISEASAALVVLGNMQGHIENAPRIADGNIERGYLKAEHRDSWVSRAQSAWATERERRDECFRAGNLLGMSIMLAAAERGWDAAPMGGYEADKLSAEFGLPEHLVPVLILAIGKRNPERELLPRGERIPARELIREGSFGA